MSASGAYYKATLYGGGRGGRVEEAEAEGEGVVAVEAVVAALIRPATTGAAVQAAAAAAAEQKP